MRIEQVVSRYENQTMNNSSRRDQTRRRALKAKQRTGGVIDMVYISPEIENSTHTVQGLVTFVHLISEEALKEWMTNSFCQPCSQEDLIVEKLLLEVL